MNDQVQPQAGPTLTAAHVRTWSRSDWRLKTTHTVPLVQALTWPVHDIIRVNGLL